MNIITNAPVIRRGNGKSTVISKGKPFGGHRNLIEFTDGNTGESIFYSADGDEYYNAKGERIKNIFKAIGKGIGKGAKGVVKGVKWLGNFIIKTVKRKKVGKNKNKVAGTSEKKGTDLPAWLLPPKAGASNSNELAHQKTESGVDIFTKTLIPATASTPQEKVVTIEGQKLSTVGVPANTPIVVSTDPTTGEKVVGVDLNPKDVTAIQGSDGTYSYYPSSQVQSGGTKDDGKRMSSTTKIAIAVGGVVVVGIIVYLIAKKK
jgi:hypothetical protein